MSLFCLCVVEGIIEKNKTVFYAQQIETLAKYYKCGITFTINWTEPLALHIEKDALIINILDSPETDNCELFLLPDGWYCNGETNQLSFKERMRFLQDICNVFINENYCIDLYFGQSGTEPREFFNVTLKNNELVEYLTKTVGTYGVDDGILISVNS